jgi:hypothetical protein
MLTIVAVSGHEHDRKWWIRKIRLITVDHHSDVEVVRLMMMVGRKRWKGERRVYRTGCVGEVACELGPRTAPAKKPEKPEKKKKNKDAAEEGEQHVMWSGQVREIGLKMGRNKARRGT